MSSGHGRSRSSALSDTPTAILPAHIEDTVQAIARLHADHARRASPLQRVVDKLTARAGRPESVAMLTVVVIVWMALNTAVTLSGRKAFDEPPFFWMQGVVGLGALYMTTLILTTQRREDEMAGHREQLTLELAILGEQKAAKTIQLLEELRRDNPMIANRIDREAEELSTPADPQAVLDALKDTHEEMIAADLAVENTPAESRSSEASA